ncbi:MAG TPA: hypothetical protein VK359_03825 [Rubrobacteraceae bacterium]|jgi:hypothetical protein|nr:hypothetical protein [Rubrobacteraceae bacterium]HZG62535.1 hypothetical protein [Rubrobacteraceae bacterium]
MPESILRVANLKSEAELELVRDTLDEIGADYEHVDSEPENSYPQTAYFDVSSDLASNIENTLDKLSEEHGFEAEILS